MTNEISEGARLKAMDRKLEGLTYVSTGPCPGCDECGLGEVDTMDCDEYEMAGEAGFSWSSCDTCGSTVGGTRYPAHGIIPKGTGKPIRGKPWPTEDLIVHLDVCVDCVVSID